MNETAGCGALCDRTVRGCAGDCGRVQEASTAALDLWIIASISLVCVWARVQYLWSCYCGFSSSLVMPWWPVACRRRSDGRRSTRSSTAGLPPPCRTCRSADGGSHGAGSLPGRSRQRCTARAGRVLCELNRTPPTVVVTADGPIDLYPSRSSFSAIHADTAPATSIDLGITTHEGTAAIDSPVSCDPFLRLPSDPSVRPVVPRSLLLSAGPRADTSTSCLLWLESFGHRWPNRQRTREMATPLRTPGSYPAYPDQLPESVATVYMRLTLLVRNTIIWHDQELQKRAHGRCLAETEGQGIPQRLVQSSAAETGVP